ncbi:DUF799 domain-containing protein [Trinickia sp.]|uniref:DUF799 domain-containing protein n=1 Tax=Trinickia sp. TaxID=2571163 RepID=UPI003F7FCEE8
MFKFFSLRLWLAFFALACLAACAAPVKHVDYTAFKSSRPRSILLLPPENATPDIKASYSMLSQMTMPVAEAGYYVVPVAVMDEAFKQNGLTTPTDIEMAPAAKLREIFGADAALYTKVTQYGSVYQVINSSTVVRASSKLVDLRTGDVLWQGSAVATGDELHGNANAGGGLIGLLVQAAVKQIIHSLTDESHDVAGLTSWRLLHAGPPNGWLYGPYSPKYQTD